jgi:chemotaxis protein histidine kinase CheA
LHRLVKEAKGAMHIHTQSGHGTTFTLYLPGATVVSH